MKEIINLSFGESLKRTFLYLFSHLNQVWRLSLVGIAIIVAADAALSFPSQYTAGETREVWKINLSMLVATLVTVSVSVAFIRQIVLKSIPTGFPVSFGWREAKYFVYNVLILVMIVILSVACGVILSLFFGGARELLNQTNMILFLLVILTVAVVLSRLCLILPAIAVDNKELTFAKTFDMTKGNSNKIFFGLFLASFPVVVILLSVSSFLQEMSVENWAGKLLISTLLAALTLLNALVKSCFLAHIYQYFIYFYTPRAEDAQPAKSLLD